MSIWGWSTMLRRSRDSYFDFVGRLDKGTTPEDLGHLLCRAALPVLIVPEYDSAPVLARLRICLELFGRMFGGLFRLVFAPCFLVAVRGLSA